MRQQDPGVWGEPYLGRSVNMEAMRRSYSFLSSKQMFYTSGLKMCCESWTDRLSSHTVQPEPWISQNDFPIPQYAWTSSPSQDIRMLEPYDPAILPLRLCPKNWKHTPEDISTSLFTAALFTITKTWKQPTTRKVKECAVHVVCAYTRVLFSIKKERNITHATT